MMRNTAHWLKMISIVLLASLFIFAGVQHFLRPEMFARIVPPYLPAPNQLVYISGVFEILGGLGILIPRKLSVKARTWFGWGLIALLVAVFPANIFMATDSAPFVESGIPLWAIYLRLPLQAVLILWVYWCTVATAPEESMVKSNESS